MNVSAIIPVYNGERFLEETVSSLVCQTAPFREIILVDDGSTDSTPSIMRDLAAQWTVIKPYFLGSNHGVSHARNFGVFQSASDWCLFWDVDDLADKGLIEAYCTYLQTMEAVGKPADLLFCAAEQIDEQGRSIGTPSRFAEIEPHEFPGYLFVRNPIVTASGVLIKRDVFCRLGGFNEELTHSEDYDLWLRVSERHVICYLDRVLVKVRRHAGNASARMQSMLDGERRVLSKYSLEKIRQTIFERRLPEERNAADFASVAFRLGHWQEGWDQLNAVIALSDSVAFYKGIYAIKHREIKAAADWFRQAVEINPNHWAAQNNLACCLWLLGSKQEARDVLTQICEKNSAYLDASRNLELMSRGVDAGYFSRLHITWRELRSVLTVYREHE